MASYLHKTLFITLIIAITIPISTGRHRRRSRSSNEVEQYLRDLCSETDRSDVCRNILKSELHRFDGTDDGDIADGMIELAMVKAEVIQDQLDKWYRDSNDERFKEKYRLCAENYNDVGRNLQAARRNLDSDDYLRISDQIDDAVGELDECKREFGSSSFDPGHVGDRNNELGLYLDIVRAATGRL